MRPLLKKSTAMGPLLLFDNSLAITTVLLIVAKHRSSSNFMTVVVFGDVLDQITLSSYIFALPVQKEDCGR